MNETVLFDFLKTHHIEYQLFKHLPVFTTEDKLYSVPEDGSQAKELSIPGTHSKNLFLKDTKNKLFFLVSVTEDKRVDLKTLSTVLGYSRFSFGKAEEMIELLKLTPGSVTPFGLMFDQQNNVRFVLDEDFLTSQSVNFHPLRNDMTINLAPQAFLTCMEKMGHKPHIIRIPVQ